METVYVWKKIIAILLMFSLISCNSISVSAAKTNIYVNARFGYSVQYPAFYKQSKRLPDNGDGITMAGKRSSLLLYGEYAVLYMTPKEMKKYVKKNKKRNEKISDTKTTKKSLYYETKTKKKISFNYHYFRKDSSIVSMNLTCPKSTKKYYKKIAKKIMRSISNRND